MRPAFASAKEAGAFAILLLTVLGGPWLVPPPRPPFGPSDYSAESVRWERYPWVQDFIYGEQGDIDIAFVGSSHLLYGIDTPYVQRELDLRLGRSTVVRSVCWKGSGFDALYFFTKELLARRRVKTLVFYDEAACEAPDQIQQYAATWMLWREYQRDFAPLPIHTRIKYYFAAVVGLPRHVLALFTPNLALDRDRSPASFLHWEPSFPETRLGSVSTRLSYDPKQGKKTGRFSPYKPDVGVGTADVATVRSTGEPPFVVADQQLEDFQVHFAREFGRLAREHSCSLVLLHPPTWAERRSSSIAESREWSQVMKVPVCKVGIPPARLFSGLEDAQIAELFFDPAHLNENGQQYFTSIITPSLLDIHESEASH